MYGQMTAERRICVETLGILDGTDETFAPTARRPGGTLSGRVVLANGVGGTGGVQQLAATMNQGAAFVVRIVRDPVARSIAREANAAEARPDTLHRDAIPDAVTDQTSAHDALNGSVPHGMSLAASAVRRDRHPPRCVDRPMVPMARHVGAMLTFRARDAATFDEGNHMCAQAHRAGAKNVFDIPGLVPEHVLPRLL